jgi:hypothetical protein
VCRASRSSIRPRLETTLTTPVELWHAAGRSAAEMRKRLLALQGVLWSGPALLLASLAAGALTLPAREAPFARPVAWTLEPLRHAYENDRDGALLLTLAFFALALGFVWAWFGGALTRMAAVDLSGRGRESARTALAFTRRHVRTLWAVPWFVVLSLAVPLLLAFGTAQLARLPGVWGGVATPVVIVVVAGLALFVVVAASLAALCASLARPAVALDDADLFDAVSRPATFAFAGLPRLVGVRLFFLAGALLGSGWRLVRTLLAAALALWLLETTLGRPRLDRLLAVIGARGMPDDAARLGVGTWDALAAGALALCAAGLIALWLADLASRLACARVAAYLVLRRAVEAVPFDHLATPPGERGPETAAEAGFDEVERVGGA